MKISKPQKPLLLTVANQDFMKWICLLHPHAHMNLHYIISRLFTCWTCWYVDVQLLYCVCMYVHVEKMNT